MILPAHWSCYLIYVTLGCCALFAACGKQQSQEVVTQATLQAQLGQAKHFDVAVPLTFNLNESSSRPSASGMTDFMRYTGSIPLAQIVDFYKREMELSGWSIIDHSVEQEAFLYCSKPKKLCGIHIRHSDLKQKDNATILSLYITQKA